MMQRLWFSFVIDPEVDSVVGVDILADVYLLDVLKAIKKEYTEELAGVGISQLIMCKNDGTPLNNKLIVTKVMLTNSCDLPLKVKNLRAQQGETVFVSCLCHFHTFAHSYQQYINCISCFIRCCTCIFSFCPQLNNRHLQQGLNFSQ